MQNYSYFAFLFEKGSEKFIKCSKPINELDSLLCHFFIKVRKVLPGTDGDYEYEPSCLSDFQKSLDRHLAKAGRTYSIVRDREFSKSEEALKAKKKHLPTQGKGRKPNKAREVTSEEFEKM